MSRPLRPLTLNFAESLAVRLDLWLRERWIASLRCAHCGDQIADEVYAYIAARDHRVVHRNCVQGEIWANNNSKN